MWVIDVEHGFGEVSLPSPKMEDYNANTDLSLYGPTAIPQISSILVIHAARRAVNITNIIHTLLGPELRETSRLAELPGNGGSARWVLEMLQPQAASLIILSEAALWSEHRISVVLESELGPEERDLARQTASSSSWGLGISSPMTEITVTPAMFGWNNYDISEGPDENLAGTGMELNEAGEGVSEQFIGDPTTAALEGADLPSPPAAPQAPVLPDHESMLMFENEIRTLFTGMLGGMGSSFGHADMVAQEQDEDEDQMNAEQMELSVRRIKNIFIQECHASRSGSGSLDVMEMAAASLYDLIGPTAT